VRPLSLPTLFGGLVEILREYSGEARNSASEGQGNPALSLYQSPVTQASAKGAPVTRGRFARPRTADHNAADQQPEDTAGNDRDEPYDGYGPKFRSQSFPRQPARVEPSKRWMPMASMPMRTG
jgi:hypothetical protein